MCDLPALSTLRGPQSVSNDMGQQPFPEKPGLVPDYVTVWEGNDSHAGIKQTATFVMSRPWKTEAHYYRINKNGFLWTKLLTVY